MNVLVSGATGLIGSTLVAAWRTQGHQVRTLVRDPARQGPSTVVPHCDTVTVAVSQIAVGFEVSQTE